MRRKSLLLSFLLIVNLPVFAENPPKGKRKAENVQILIVGLKDNVKSNYYYPEKIAEETGITADSIDKQFDLIIAENIKTAQSGAQVKFVSDIDSKLVENFAEQILVNGEAENCNSSLTNLPTAAFKETLDEAKANYLLVINQHYLKWQSKPMRTVFHIVSYTLYDKDKKQVTTGNQFFSTMKLESPDKIKLLSRKTSSKIASSVVKSLDL